MITCDSDIQVKRVYLQDGYGAKKERYSDPNKAFMLQVDGRPVKFLSLDLLNRLIKDESLA